MTTTTAAAPTFDPTHDHPLAAVTGYDVIRSTVDAGEVHLTVTAVVRGGDRYAVALAAARLHRGDASRGWGYTSTRYACGCRWVATLTGPVGDNPAPVFADHPDA